jgi:hypothetical protein
VVAGGGAVVLDDEDEDEVDAVVKVLEELVCSVASSDAQ